MNIHVNREANYSDFYGIILIFKADFRITISNMKIKANNNFKMVPDQITGLIPTSTPVIPDNIIQTGLCVIYWKNVTLAGKKVASPRTRL